MDTSLGALTIEQRAEMMKKGLCFGSGKHGHLSKDCPDKKKPTIPLTSTPSSSSPLSYSPQSKWVWKNFILTFNLSPLWWMKKRKKNFMMKPRKRVLKWRATSTSDSPIVDVFSVNLGTIESNSLSIPILIKNAKENKNIKTLGLIDSGAGGKFINQNYVRNAGFEIQTLERPIITWNIDGTKNKKGKITPFVNLELTINGREMMTHLLITRLGKQRIILGFPWLNEHNPDIDWKTGKFAWRTNSNKWKRPFRIKRHYNKHPCAPLKQVKTLAQLTLWPIITEDPDPEEKFNCTLNPTKNNEILLAYLEEEQKPNELWIDMKTTTAIEFHLKHDNKNKTYL